jgi:hypothetical protein
VSRRAAAGVALLACALPLLAAGCGGITSPDLFIVYRSGATPHARLTMLVTEEGVVQCDGGPHLKLSDSQIVVARAIQEEIKEQASSHLSLPARPGSVLAYYLRDQDGTVHFADNSAKQPKVLRQLALFVLQAAQQVCHLPE